MKKVLLLIMLSLILVGCSNNTAVTNPKENKSETTITETQPKVEENVEVKEEVKKIEVPIISDEELKTIDEAVKMCTVGTAFEDAQFKYGYALNSEETGINLEIHVIKSMDSLMEHYNTDVDGLVKTIRQSLTFDSVLDIIKDKLSNDYEYLYVRFEDTENDMYSMKSIKNE